VLLRLQHRNAYRSWIFPRAPQFAAKAGRELDLYQGRCDSGQVYLVKFVTVQTGWENAHASFRLTVSTNGPAPRARSGDSNKLLV
jgi:hypothetical protein